MKALNWCIFLIATRLKCTKSATQRDRDMLQQNPESIVMRRAHSPRVLARVVDRHWALKKKANFMLLLLLRLLLFLF